MASAPLPTAGGSHQGLWSPGHSTFSRMLSVAVISSPPKAALIVNKQGSWSLNKELQWALSSIPSFRDEKLSPTKGR